MTINVVLVLQKPQSKTSKTKQGGVSFLDISTGEFYVAEGSIDYINKLIQSFRPKEVLYERGTKDQFQEYFGMGFYIYAIDEWVYSEQAATDRLLKHFQTQSLKGFGIDKLTLGTIAAGSVLYYLDITQHTQISNITGIRRIAEDEFVWINRFTFRNLEVFSPLNEDGHSLMFYKSLNLRQVKHNRIKKRARGGKRVSQALPDSHCKYTFFPIKLLHIN